MRFFPFCLILRTGIFSTILATIRGQNSGPLFVMDIAQDETNVVMPTLPPFLPTFFPRTTTPPIPPLTISTSDQIPTTETPFPTTQVIQPTLLSSITANGERASLVPFTKDRTNDSSSVAVESSVVGLQSDSVALLPQTVDTTALLSTTLASFAVGSTALLSSDVPAFSAIPSPSLVYTESAMQSSSLVLSTVSFVSAFSSAFPVLIGGPSAQDDSFSPRTPDSMLVIPRITVAPLLPFTSVNFVRSDVVSVTLDSASLRPTATVLPMANSVSTSSPSATPFTRPSTTWTTPFRYFTMTTPVPLIWTNRTDWLRMGILLPPGNFSEDSLRQKLAVGLQRVFQVGDARLRAYWILSTVNRTTLTSTVASAERTRESNTTVEVEVVSNSWDNRTGNVSADFAVYRNDVIVPSQDVFARFSLVSVDEMTRLLNLTVLQRPSAFMNGLVGVTESSVRSEVLNATGGGINSTLLGAVVGVSTVAVVLLSIALIWLILFIWIRCTKRSSKTSPTDMLRTSAAQTDLPVTLLSVHPRVDQGMQTVILPRRSLVPDDERSQYDSPPPRNGGPVPRMIKEPRRSTVVQRSFLNQRPAPDAARVVEESPREARGPSLRRNGEARRERVEEPYVQETDRRGLDDVMALGDGDSRIKLVSVVKTNRVEPFGQLEDGRINHPREPTSRVLPKTRSASAHRPGGRNGVLLPKRTRSPSADRRFDRPDGYDREPPPRHIPLTIRQTIREIKQEVQLWQSTQT